MEENQNFKNDGWHRSHTLILLTELQKYKCLYDPLDENFINKPMRSEKLNLIRDTLKRTKKNVTVVEIKKKIKSLKAQLWKETHKTLISKKGGSESDKPKLWCYNEISFLLNASETEPSQSNIDLVELRTDTEESNDNLEDSRSGITPEKKRKYKAEQLEECGMGANEFMKQNFENTTVKQPLEKEEQFCQYLSSLLKKIKLEETFDDISLQIITLVNQKISDERKKLQATNYFPPIHNSQSFIDPPMLSSTPPFVITIPTSFRNTPSPSLPQVDEFIYLPNSSCSNYLDSPSLSLHQLPKIELPYSSELNNADHPETACSSRNSPDIPPTHQRIQSSSSTSSTNSLKIRTPSCTLRLSEPFHYPYNEEKPYLIRSRSRSSSVNRDSLDVTSPTTLNSSRSFPHPEKKSKSIYIK